MKMEMGSTPSPVVDIVTLRRLLEIMRLDSTPVLLKVCREIERDGHHNNARVIKSNRVYVLSYGTLGHRLGQDSRRPGLHGEYGNGYNSVER